MFYKEKNKNFERKYWNDTKLCEEEGLVQVKKWIHAE